MPEFPKYIDAPYNFVPLSDRIFAPQWGRLVSHDVPFRDGLCGSFEIELHARTPVLVGGEHTRPHGDAGEVRFFRTPDGSYAIPGSSIKGMIRGLLEIAAFGRMNKVDDRRYGLRDISGRFVASAYMKRALAVRFGLMQIQPGGLPAVTECSAASLRHRDIEQHLRSAKPVFKAGESVGDKYRKWQTLCEKAGIKDPLDFPFSFDPRPNQRDRLKQTAVPDGSGKHRGYPVFTGQINDSTIRPGKKRDFVFFFDQEPGAALPVKDRVWRDFLFIHEPEAGRPDKGSWAGHWRKLFYTGARIPVFYLVDEKKDVSHLGLAYMPKLAGDFGIHKLIENTSREHLAAAGAAGGRDLATVLFGDAGAAADDALKSRVSFAPAYAQGTPEPTPTGETILAQPRPSYFPNYLEQKADAPGWTLGKGATYATYMKAQDAGARAPSVRGWKRYPARPDPQVQRPDKDQAANKNIQVRLYPLPEGTVFKGRVVLHNLKPEELGALLWALELGGDKALVHGLGMGKPFGFGQVAIEVAALDLEANDPGRPAAAEKAHYVDRFVECMDQWTGSKWRETPQMLTLLAMLDPAKGGEGKQFPGKLRHMSLQDYVRAKSNGLALARYLPIASVPTTAAEAGAMPPWARDTIARVMKEDRIPQKHMDDALRGRKLAFAWKDIADAALKRAVKSWIENAWREKGWWEHPPGSAAKEAKQIYVSGGDDPPATGV